MEALVLIVGAGPAGLATSACLNHLNIPNVIVEREDCYASMWNKKTYDRLQLHIAKQYCQLPHMPYPPDTPMFIPKSGFISYLDDYVSHFRLNPRYNCSVESASYDKNAEKWRVTIKNTKLNFTDVYYVKFLVAATGENSEGLIPEIRGLESFEGEYMHSTKYKNGKTFSGKGVLVVGVGNSGMEIAYDLSSRGATTSIVARGPVHVVTKEMVLLGMFLLRFFPCKLVDFMTVILSRIKFGDISKYGLQRPEQGPFFLKATAGRSPTIDVGTVEKIRKGTIEVLPPITVIEGKEITFENGKRNQYDAIIFATGYRSTVGNWLQDGCDLFDENGMPKQRFPNHWKGKDGLYCAGFSQMGLMGISNDAQNIARDISTVLAQTPLTFP